VHALAVPDNLRRYPSTPNDRARSLVFGGVPGMVVSDNLKSGITKACFDEPAVNRDDLACAAPQRHHPVRRFGTILGTRKCSIKLTT
jgi:hypothetical protein